MPQELPFPTRDAIRHRFGAAYFADNLFMGAKSMSYKDRSRKNYFGIYVFTLATRQSSF
jgi:hypothetical protein